MTDKHANIRESLNGITEGKWEQAVDFVIVKRNEKYTREIADCGTTYDANFIANAPEYVRRLLDEVERLEADVKNYDSKVVDLLDQIHDLNAENNR